MTTLYDTIPSDILCRLGWMLLHSLWQFALIAIVLAVTLEMLRGRSAATRYLTCWVALSGALLAAVVTLTLVPGTAPHHTATTANETSVNTSAPKELASSGAVTQVGTEPEIRLEAPRLELEAEPSRHFEAAATRPHETSDGGTEAPGTTEATSDAPQIVEQVPLFGERLAGAVRPWLPGVSLFWFGGVLLLSLWNAYAWFGVMRLRRTGTNPVGVELAGRVTALANRMKLRGSVRALQSVLVEVPGVVGWWRPVLLMPAGLITGLSPQQLDAILAHELAHIQRHDYLCNLLQTVVETLLFYHPAIWWISRRIRVEREYCCDDVAVRVCGDPVEYASVLASFEELRAAPHPAVAANDGNTLTRVRRILRASTPSRRPTKSLAGSLAVVAIIAATIVCFVRAGEEQNVSDELGIAPQQSVAAEAELKNLGAQLKRNEDGEVTTISLNGTATTDADLAQLASLRHLTSLNLGNTKITDKGLVHVAAVEGLEQLLLAGTSIGDNGVAHLAKLKNLKTLGLTRTQVTDDGMAHLKNMRSLTSLLLVSTQIGDAGLVHLKDMTQLEQLYIDGHPTEDSRIDDKAIVHVARLSRLRQLGLSRTKISGAGLAHLAELGELESVVLDHTNISGEGLAYLTKLPRLHHLSVANTSLTDDVDENHTNDDAVERLKEMRGLRTLNLQGTRISVPGFIELQKAMPKTTIHFLTGDQKRRDAHSHKSDETEKTKKVVARLKKSTEFAVNLRYHGPEETDDAQRPRSIQFIGPGLPFGSPPTQNVQQLRLTRAQVRQLIDAVAVTGYWDQAAIVKKLPASLKGPAYTLSVHAAVNGEPWSYYLDLKWGAPMLKQLELLGSSVDGELAKAIDIVLVQVGEQLAESPSASIERLASEADRIVLFKSLSGKPTQIVRTLKGSQEINGRFDHLLKAHPERVEGKLSMIFLREQPSDVYAWLGLAPAVDDSKKWLQIADPKFITRVEESIPLPAHWSKPVDGVSIGVRPRSPVIADPEQLILEVAMTSSERKEVWNHRLNIYDYWPRTQFEVTSPNGHKFILAKPEGYFSEDDSPGRRMLEPGKPYIHAFYLSDWGVHKQGEAPAWLHTRERRRKTVAKAFAKPGKYTFRAIYGSKHKRGDADFIGRLVSPPVTVTFTAPASEEEAIELDTDSIQFEAHPFPWDDGVEPGLFPVGWYRSSDRLAAKTVYLRCLAGDFGLGLPGQEVVGRLPVSLPEFNRHNGTTGYGARLIVDRYVQKGMNLVADVKYIPPTLQPNFLSAKKYVPISVYLRAYLPNDLPPGKYQVVFNFSDHMYGKDGKLVPGPKDQPPTISSMKCPFEVPKKAAAAPQEAASEKANQVPHPEEGARLELHFNPTFSEDRAFLDKAPGEIYVVGPSEPTEGEAPTAKQLYDLRRTEQIEDGHRQLVTRLKSLVVGYRSARGGDRFVVEGFKREGNRFSGSLKFVQRNMKQRFSENDVHAVYLRASLPDDLPPGKYDVVINTVEYMQGEDGKTIVPMPKDRPPSFPPVTCQFEVPKRAAAAPQEAALDQADQTAKEAEPIDNIPKHLRAWGGLFIRSGDQIIHAGADDVRVAKGYPTFNNKGKVHKGRRVTVMSAKRQYEVGEEIRVLHVLEAVKPGDKVFVMGPKAVYGEYIDGKLVTNDVPKLAHYDGRVLDSPAVDYNYDITTYTFDKPGEHAIQWKAAGPFDGERLESNVLKVTVVVAANEQGTESTETRASLQEKIKLVMKRDPTVRGLQQRLPALQPEQVTMKWDGQWIGYVFEMSYPVDDQFSIHARGLLAIADATGGKLESNDIVGPTDKMFLMAKPDVRSRRAPKEAAVPTLAEERKRLVALKQAEFRKHKAIVLDETLDEAKRRLALYRIGELGTKQSADLLGFVYDHNHPIGRSHERLEILDMLQKYGSAECLILLDKASRDPGVGGDERWYAARALARIQGPESLPRLKEMYQVETVPTARRQIRIELARLGDPAAVAGIRADIRRGDPVALSAATTARLKAAAADALALCRTEQKTPLRVQVRAAFTALRMGDRRAVPILIEYLDRPEMVAANSLGSPMETYLEHATGQDLGSKSKPWLAWWNEKGKKQPVRTAYVADATRRAIALAAIDWGRKKDSGPFITRRLCYLVLPTDGPKFSSDTVRTYTRPELKLLGKMNGESFAISEIGQAGDGAFATLSYVGGFDKAPSWELELLLKNGEWSVIRATERFPHRIESKGRVWNAGHEDKSTIEKAKAVGSEKAPEPRENRREADDPQAIGIDGVNVAVAPGQPVFKPTDSVYLDVTATNNANESRYLGICPHSGRYDEGQKTTAVEIDDRVKEVAGLPCFMDARDNQSWSVRLNSNGYSDRYRDSLELKPGARARFKVFIPASGDGNRPRPTGRYSIFSRFAVSRSADGPRTLGNGPESVLLIVDRRKLGPAVKTLQEGLAGAVKTESDIVDAARILGRNPAPEYANLMVKVVRHPWPNHQHIVGSLWYDAVNFSGPEIYAAAAEEAKNPRNSGRLAYETMYRNRGYLKRGDVMQLLDSPLLNDLEFTNVNNRGFWTTFLLALVAEEEDIPLLGDLYARFVPARIGHDLCNHAMLDRRMLPIQAAFMRYPEASREVLRDVLAKGLNPGEFQPWAHEYSVGLTPRPLGIAAGWSADLKDTQAIPLLEQCAVHARVRISDSMRRQSHELIAAIDGPDAMKALRRIGPRGVRERGKLGDPVAIDMLLKSARELRGSRWDDTGESSMIFSLVFSIMNPEKTPALETTAWMTTVEEQWKKRRSEFVQAFVKKYGFNPD